MYFESVGTVTAGSEVWVQLGSGQRRHLGSVQDLRKETRQVGTWGPSAPLCRLSWGVWWLPGAGCHHTSVRCRDQAPMAENLAASVQGAALGSSPGFAIPSTPFPRQGSAQVLTSCPPRTSEHLGGKLQTPPSSERSGWDYPHSQWQVFQPLPASYQDAFHSQLLQESKTHTGDKKFIAVFCCFLEGKSKRKLMAGAF